MREGLAPEILAQTIAHAVLVLTALSSRRASLGIPAGVALTPPAGGARWVLSLANVAQTMPSLALFGFLIPLPFIGGIGAPHGDRRARPLRPPADPAQHAHGPPRRRPRRAGVRRRDGDDAAPAALPRRASARGADDPRGDPDGRRPDGRHGDDRGRDRGRRPRRLHLPRPRVRGHRPDPGRRGARGAPRARSSTEVSDGSSEGCRPRDGAPASSGRSRPSPRSRGARSRARSSSARRTSRSRSSSGRSPPSSSSGASAHP